MKAPAASAPPSSPAARAGDIALRFGPVAVVVVLAAVVWFSGALHHLSLTELGERRTMLHALVAAHPVVSAGAYVAVYAIAIALSLPAALVMTLTGGFLFGVSEGAALAVIGATAGSIAIFMICRTAVGDALRRRAGPRMARLHEAAHRNAFAFLLSLRLMPVMPFWLINIGAACLKTSLKTFALTTVLGVIPSSLIFAGVGAGLGKVFEAGERPGFGMILQPHFLLPLAALGVLSLAPVAWRMFRRGGAHG